VGLFQAGRGFGPFATATMQTVGALTPGISSCGNLGWRAAVEGGVFRSGAWIGDLPKVSVAPVVGWIDQLAGAAGWCAAGSGAPGAEI